MGCPLSRPFARATSLTSPRYLPLASAAKPSGLHSPPPSYHSLFTAASEKPHPAMACPMGPDPNSFANTAQVAVRHLSLDLAVDFTRKVLHGTATHVIALVDPQARTAVFDSKSLNIQDVQVAVDQGPFVPAEYIVADAHPKFGNAIQVALPAAVATAAETRVRIHYETTASGTAIQFLAPEQTAGKVHPYLFTQCQAIHARTMAPCQDTPAVKITYDARITVPKPLRALMSALPREISETDDADGTVSVYAFEQPTAIPSYLLALVVGNLQGQRIGPRSHVWAEPEVVGAAAWEFADVEKFVAAAEDLLTPYQWGVYDLLVVPPSFPFGGMENPCLTFVTPTLLAGDRSLVDVVIHEIAHSWTGNLVTNRDWGSFWLNEGWTMFVERKVLGRLKGEAVRHFSAILGWKELFKTVKRIGMTHPFTALVPNLENEDPDDAFSTVPYEKGCSFLFYLEQHLGGAAVFEPYMRAYIRRFAGESIDTQQWKDFLYEHMTVHHPDGAAKAHALLEQVAWDAWLYNPGMPHVKPHFDETLLKDCQALVDRWKAAQAGTGPWDFEASDIAQFTTEQKVMFLSTLLEWEPLTHTVLDRMDHLYQWTPVRNGEIRLRWQTLCLVAKYTPIFPHVVAFVLEQGRMKYIRPLYRNLYHSTPEGARLARSTFCGNRQIYHPIAASMLAKDLGLDE
ncbi:Leucyl aminopeptidase yscIV [Dimargaris xerosporica]|nr:Leucyl aminopeptidase yscIV [Dimargaris xerosporica]